MHFVIIVLTILLTACSNTEPKSVDLSMLLETQQSAEVTLPLKKLIGKTGTIINFWASWCSNCQEEIPALIALKGQFKTKGIELILISIDEDRYVFEEYLIKYKPRHDMYRSVTNIPLEILPTTFLLDNNGDAVSVWYGKKDWASKALMEQIVTNLSV